MYNLKKNQLNLTKLLTVLSNSPNYNGFFKNALPLIVPFLSKHS